MLLSYQFDFLIIIFNASARSESDTKIEFQLIFYNTTFFFYFSFLKKQENVTYKKKYYQDLSCIIYRNFYRNA